MPPERPDSRGTPSAALALGALTVLAALLRFATLDLQSFGHDEAVTAFQVLQPGLDETLDRVVEAKERNPPLHYLLAWAWSQGFGSGEVALRSLSALCGTLCVPVAWLAARELATPRAGLAAAALVAVNPFLVWYSQEARPYALLVLLVTLSLWLMARAVARGGGGALALWALATAGALATHYFAVFVVAAQALWLLHRLRSMRALAAVAAVGAAGGGLLPIALAQNAERPGVFSETSLGDRLARTLTGLWSGNRLDILREPAAAELLSAAVAVLATGLVVTGIALVRFRSGDRERRGGLLCGWLGALALGVPLVLALVGTDLVTARNLIVALPPLLLAAAIGLAVRRPGRLGALLVVALCVLSLVNVVAVIVSPSLQRRDFRAMAQAIGNAPDARLIVAPRIAVPALDGYLPELVVRLREGPDAGLRGLRRERSLTCSVVVVDHMEGSELPSPRSLRSLPARLALAGRATVDGYGIVALRSPAPVEVDLSRLALVAGAPANPIVLEQRPRRTGPLRGCGQVPRGRTLTGPSRNT